MKKVLVSPHYSELNGTWKVNTFSSFVNFLLEESCLPIIATTKSGFEYNNFTEKRYHIGEIKNLVEAYFDLKPCGVVLTGGASVDSAFHNFEEEFTCHSQIFRDLFELEILKVATDRGVPVLGICRGMQLINVAFGGSLKYVKNKNLHIKHRPEEYETDEERELLDQHNKNKEAKIKTKNSIENMVQSKLHKIQLVDSELFPELETIFGRDSMVNSIHFQGIKEIATSLNINAVSEDGEIEIISNKNKKILGVQFHPEIDTQDLEYRKLLKMWLEWL